jgi:hypothetical protein
VPAVEQALGALPLKLPAQASHRSEVEAEDIGDL